MGGVHDLVAFDFREMTLLRPRKPEALIDEHAFDEDEFLPYWAELWPSAHALIDALDAIDLRGRRVLEVGCGLGLPSLVAAVSGAEVTATDWSPAAIDLLRDNAARNGVPVNARVWRWDADPGELGPAWPLVIGADLLYERRNVGWLLRALDGLLSAGGEAWIADPGRPFADEFFARAGDRVRRLACNPPGVWRGSGDGGVGPAA